VMFLLGIFIGVFLCVVVLRFFQCHNFWIIDSGCLTNHSIGREGSLVFLLKAWIRLLEGVGFYTAGSLELVRETFMDINNPTRDEPVHKKVMAKCFEDKNKGTPTQGDSCVFPSFGNVGAPLMASLNISGLNVGLTIWLWTTSNVVNSLDASEINTLC